MMKFRTTSKELRGLPYTYKCGYCALQHLLHYVNPVAYTCGVYGWNFDVYELKGYITITTGYRGMVGKQIDYDICKKYDVKAEKIIYNYTAKWSCETKKRKVTKLLEKFCDEIVGKEVK